MSRVVDDLQIACLCQCPANAGQLGAAVTVQDFITMSFPSPTDSMILTWRSAPHRMAVYRTAHGGVSLTNAVPSMKQRVRRHRYAHRAVSAEAAEAGTEDGAADEGSVAADHVHDAAAGEVDGAAAEQQVAVLPATSVESLLKHPATFLAHCKRTASCLKKHSPYPWQPPGLWSRA